MEAGYLFGAERIVFSLYSVYDVYAKFENWKFTLNEWSIVLIIGLK